MENQFKSASDEEKIISKAIAGDKDAFTEVYHAYTKKVFFMAIQYFKDEEIANDIVQEVFIKVYKQINTLKIAKAFNSWLYTITYRECQNYNRRKMKVFNLKDSESMDDFADDKNINVLRQVENERIRKVILNTLETMKEPLRMVAVLRFFEDLKISQIANTLDIPEATVKSRITRVREILSDELSKQGVAKNFSITLISPAVIYEAYLLLYDNYSVNEEVINTILKTVLTGSSAISSSLIATKKILSGAFLASAVGGIILFSHTQAETDQNIIATNQIPTIEVLPQVNEELATISDIVYDHSWTNQSIQVEINTTNKNYDSILINSTIKRQVDENGTYTIQLMKDNQVLDERVIVISNIDKEHPVARGEERGNDYIIYLSDQLSGINETSIHYYKNGNIDNTYQYDKTQNIIIIRNDVNSVHELRVQDMAGNEVSIVLKST